MSTVKVRVELNKEGFIPLCKSAAVQAQLHDAAVKMANDAESRIGSPARSRNFKNKNFIAASRQLDRTAVARVSAANPRSDWYAKNKGVLDR